MDADTFLMPFRRFISRRGKPFELLSDCGTNFKAGEVELQNAFRAMAPDAQRQLAHSQVNFQFNPPSASHFGGSWEREIKSIKMALSAAVGTQPTSEAVLHTVLVEVEGILNSKPLGYVSSDLADPGGRTLPFLRPSTAKATFSVGGDGATAKFWLWRDQSGNRLIPLPELSDT